MMMVVDTGELMWFVTETEEKAVVHDGCSGWLTSLRKHKAERKA